MILNSRLLKLKKKIEKHSQLLFIAAWLQVKNSGFLIPTEQNQNRTLCKIAENCSMNVTSHFFTGPAKFFKQECAVEKL